MTQHRPKAPTNLTMVLLLALIATPLTIDQRGGVGINQASAQSGHSVSRAEPGEGSAKDKVADAGQAKQDAAIRNALDNELQNLEARELTHPNVIIERQELLVQDTLNTMNRPEQ
jgi:hypothetical protein